MLKPQQPLKNIIVILDRPAHAGNIGATARALDNMGLNRLRVIQPRQFPHPDAIQFAAGSATILDTIEIFPDVATAVADINYLVASSNRPRGQRHTVYTPRQLAQTLPTILKRPETQVGLLFGTERTGLETIDLNRADVLCNIPTAGTHGSLNLGQAVLVVVYEIMLALGEGNSFDFDPTQEGPRANNHEMALLFEHMQTALTAIDFLKPDQSRHMMGSLQAIFNRAALDQREVAIFRGIFHEILASQHPRQKPT